MRGLGCFQNTLNPLTFIIFSHSILSTHSSIHELRKTMKQNKKVIPNKPIKLVEDKSQKWYVLALIVVSFIFYGNTCYNDYCLDDSVVITENTSTQKGFAGIKEHISQDMLYGYTHTKGRKAASAGWRPLSMITFSMEVGFFGANHPGISHFINVMIFAVIVAVLYLFLKNHLLKNQWLSFFTALLFTIHPIHTEVVANIKSRDELLCLLFVLLALIQLWKYFSEKRNRHLLLSYLFYFLAFTSKETGITFILGIPLMLYFFTELKTKQILTYTSGFIAMALFYLVMRNAFVPFTNVVANPEIINNAFLKATGMEAFATKFYVLILYIKLLLFPSPLSYDYSYNQIPYQQFSNPLVLLSLLFYVGIFIFSLTGFKKKDKLSFSILMFLITLSIGSNLFIEIGMLMGERLVFIPSIFFLLAIVIIGERFISFLSQKINAKKIILAGFFILPVIVASAYQTISRNAEWKNNQTLSLADIKKNPESARVNCAAGSAYLFTITNTTVPENEKDSLLSKAIIHLNKSIAIYPEYNDALLDLGFAYNLKNDFDKADEYWSRVRARTPNHPKLKIFDNFLATKYLDIAVAAEQKSKLDSAIYYYNKAAIYGFHKDSTMLVINYNLGGIYYNSGNFPKAQESLQKVLAIDPNYANARQGLEATEQMMKK